MDKTFVLLMGTDELKGIDPSDGQQRWKYVPEEPWVMIGPAHFDSQTRSLMVLQRDSRNYGDSRLARVRVPVSSEGLTVETSDILPDKYAEGLGLRGSHLTYVGSPYVGSPDSVVRGFTFSFNN